MNKNQTQLGKLPPQAIDLEEAVLGALMLEKDALMNVIDILNEESFYKDAHQRIFKAIQRLSDKNSPIDILTVTAEIKSMGLLESIGGAFYITELTNRVAGAANIEFHARIIKQKHIQREIIRVGSEMINNSYEDTTDIFDLIDYASNSLYEMVSSTLGKDFTTIDKIVPQRIKAYEKPLNSGLTGISTGLKELDDITNGWQNGSLIILAARPSMGKTALALNFLRAASVKEGLSAAIFSLEMSKEQLVDRLIAAECEIELEALKKRNLRIDQWNSLQTKITKVLEAKITIDESSSLTINQIKAKAVRLKQKHNIKLLLVDYLQLLTGTKGKGNREQEISEISRGLKHISKDLDIPVIALSQLSRQVENRPGGSKKPMLSDLRESGSIEQDADVVMFLYRPEYYGLAEDENGNATSGIANIIVAKNRDGKVDEAICRWVGKFQKFVDLDDKTEYNDFNNHNAITANYNFDNNPFN